MFRPNTLPILLFSFVSINSIAGGFTGQSNDESPSKKQRTAPSAAAAATCVAACANSAASASCALAPQTRPGLTRILPDALLRLTFSYLAPQELIAVRRVDRRAFVNAILLSI